jgi:hypothetical protein
MLGGATESPQILPKSNGRTSPDQGDETVQPDQVTDLLDAYQLVKPGNSLRVRPTVRWGKRGGRIKHDQPRHHRYVSRP